MKYIKQIIKESLKFRLSESSDPFEDISSFGDIDEEKIQEIVDKVGYAGYNSKEDATEVLIEKMKSWKEFSDPVRLYRILGVKNEKFIKKQELGEHWTPYKWHLNDNLLTIVSDIWDEDVEAYVIEALVPHSEIDIPQTIIQNLNFPNEEEINVKNKGRNLKIDKIYKLDDE